MYNKKEHKFEYNSRKSLEALLFIIANIHDLHKSLKILYWADQKHLSRYGRLIAGDTFKKMENGAVPSLAYEIAKIARGDGGVWYCDLEVEEIKNSIEFTAQETMKPLRPANEEYLSETDIECLLEAYEEINGLSFPDMKKKFHEEDKAYSSVEIMNATIPLKRIIEMNLPNGDKVLELLETQYQ